MNMIVFSHILLAVPYYVKHYNYTEENVDLMLAVLLPQIVREGHDRHSIHWLGEDTGVHTTHHHVQSGAGEGDAIWEK